jgi:hypothetical protein
VIGDEARLPAFALEEDASPAEIAALRDRLAQLAARAARIEAPARPFLVVTPRGLAPREAIAEAITAAGVALGGAIEAIDAFPVAATALYVRDDDEESLHRALAFERLWQARGADHGERWTLASREAFDRLVAKKRAVRAGFPSWAVRLTTPERAWIARLHAFHVPDPDRLEAESRLLDALRG